VRKSRKQSHQTSSPATFDQISLYMQCLEDEHQQAWHVELTGPAPHWVYLLGLHLRMVELEQLEPAAQELL